MEPRSGRPRTSLRPPLTNTWPISDKICKHPPILATLRHPQSNCNKCEVSVSNSPGHVMFRSFWAIVSPLVAEDCVFAVCLPLIRRLLMGKDGIAHNANPLPRVGMAHPHLPLVNSSSALAGRGLAFVSPVVQSSWGRQWCTQSAYKLAGSGLIPVSCTRTTLLCGLPGESVRGI